MSSHCETRFSGGADMMSGANVLTVRSGAGVGRRKPPAAPTSVYRLLDEEGPCANVTDYVIITAVARRNTWIIKGITGRFISTGTRCTSAPLI